MLDMSMMNSLSNLRKSLLAKRQTLALDTKRTMFFHQNIANLLHSPKYQHVKSIAFYWPIRGEPDIKVPLLEWLNQDTTRTIALPVTQKDQALNFFEWNPSTQMAPGLYDIMEPQNSKSVLPELIFTPCLGWQAIDGKLWRLGYGGGYYDRTMAHLHSINQTPNLVGISFAELEVKTNEWQAQAHDMPLDAIITESAVVSSSSNV